MLTRVLAATLPLLSCAGSSDASNFEDEGPPESRGTAGARVWFPSSESIEIRQIWAVSGPASVTPTSGSRCWFFVRDALSNDQRDALEGTTLVPLTDACTADGFSYHELTVIDRDGSEAVYRDTGCSYLRVEGAMAMLPPNSFPTNVFPGDTATACFD